MGKINPSQSPILEKISSFDFDKYYTPKVRIICHVVMWSFFTLLQFLAYRLEFKLPISDGIILSARAAINSSTIFYLYFYLIIPYVLKKSFWNIFLLILLIPLSVYIWLTLNYIQIKILYHFHYEITQGFLKGVVTKNAKQTLSEALTIDTVIGNAISVVGIFSPYFCVKILFDVTRLFSKTIHLQKQKSELELQNLNIEKDFLKSQLNPHFLFNTLNNLYGLVVKKDASAPDVIVNISDLMAYTLYESNTEKVPLQKELDFIKNYFQLEKMRHSSSKDISIEVIAPENSKYEISPLLSFPFLENAFKYGLKDSTNSFLHLKIHVSDGIFHLEIENNKEQNNENSSIGGIGLNNTKKRLNLLYPKKHDLRIEDSEHKYLVSLDINMN